MSMEIKFFCKLDTLQFVNKFTSAQKVCVVPVPIVNKLLRFEFKLFSNYFLIKMDVTDKREYTNLPYIYINFV